jgi:hypothetical protein
LRGCAPGRTIWLLEPQPIIYREEVTAILGAFADLNVHVRRILDLLEDELGGEEEIPEDDS